ncbi:MAG TPA: DUF2934 domain-containing protein [Casimicrobiaceae bacterium]
MKQSIGGKSARDARKGTIRRRQVHKAAASHPHSTPIIASGNEAEQDRDQPFVEGAQDAIDPDLRHRMISETAYRRYADRGYVDGYDIDDWLQAETEVDHLLLNPSPQSGAQSGA